MRKLDRSGVKPPKDWGNTLKDTFKRNNADFNVFQSKAKDFEKLRLNSVTRRTGFKSFADNVLPKSGTSRNWKPIWGQSKDLVSDMSNDKCAYCETPINARRSEQVEHFKPKSIFPTGAYDWDNYFIACNGCNGAKSDKWPKNGSYVRPDQGKPQDRFVFSRDGSIKAKANDLDGNNTLRDFAPG